MTDYTFSKNRGTALPESLTPNSNNFKFSGNYPKINYRVARRKDLTIVIGAKCSDGIVLIADSKVLRGGEWECQSKIRGDILKGVVVGASGTTTFFDKFRRHIVFQTNQIRQQKQDLTQPPYENIEQFLVTCERILRFYKVEYEIEENESPIELLIALNTLDGNPTLHFLNTSENVAEEEINKYLVIGHGSPYASIFMKKLWDKDMTMEQITVLGCSIIKIIEDSGLDITIGGNPDIWFIPKTTDNYQVMGNEIQKILNKRDEFIVNFEQKFSELKSFLRS